MTPIWVGLGRSLGIATTLISAWTSAAAQTDEAARLETLRGLDRRVIGVMHKLAVANVELCPSTRNLAGWALHSAEQYSAAVRPEAQSRFRLRGAFPSVLALAADGPAATAGVREEDGLLAINGTDLGSEGRRDRTDEPASYAPLGRQMELINAALAAGSVNLTIARGTVIDDLKITPVLACGYEAQVIVSPALNGGADGTRISITSGLVAYAQSDDELAFLLGHELAHNVLRHAERPRSRGPAGLFGRNGRSPSAVGDAEQAADRVGMFLAARAGYDMSGSAAFRRRFARDHAEARYGFWGYPSAEARALAHETTWREIEALRHQGAPLLP